MKLFVKSVVFAFVLTVIFSLLPFQAHCRDITQEVFRLHVTANSDSFYDQVLKLRVRDRVLKAGEQLFAAAHSAQEAENAVRENLTFLQEQAQREVYRRGYDYPVRAQVVRMYFSTRYYENYTLPAGMYDALRITVGKGEGHNWWCVMYPSLCLSAAAERDTQAREALPEDDFNLVRNENTEYKFKIVELFEGICALFEQR